MAILPAVTGNDRTLSGAWPEMIRTPSGVGRTPGGASSYSGRSESYLQRDRSHNTREGRAVQGEESSLMVFLKKHNTAPSVSRQPCRSAAIETAPAVWWWCPYKK